MANETLPLQKGKPIKDEVTILVGGQAFTGWENVSITKNLESIANSFSIKLFDKFAGLRSAWPLRPGTSVKVNINQKRVMTGRIEINTPSYTAERRDYAISGRSRPGDLVDCMHKGPCEYLNIDIIKLAKELVDPFGLKVFESVFGDKAPPQITKFTLKPGETVFEALDRAARNEGFLWISTSGGNIRLTRAGATEARFRAFSLLRQDFNILGASAIYDDSKRHNEYIVKGQASGQPNFSGDKAAQAEGTALDLGVTRHRPLVMIAESNADSAQAETRAQWEAAIRLAKATRVNAAVQGWTQANGELWDVNQIVHFHSSFLGLNRDLLIVTVNHTDGTEAGKATTLTLTDPKAYTPEPVKNKTKKDDIFASLGADF